MALVICGLAIAVLIHYPRPVNGVQNLFFGGYLLWFLLKVKKVTKRLKQWSLVIQSFGIRGIFSGRNTHEYGGTAIFLFGLPNSAFVFSKLYANFTSLELWKFLLMSENYSVVFLNYNHRIPCFGIWTLQCQIVFQPKTCVLTLYMCFFNIVSLMSLKRKMSTTACS